MSKHLCTDCQQWKAAAAGERCQLCHDAHRLNISTIAAEMQREALNELETQRGNRHGK